jgi:nucleotide-binding universal stress UspA family protein
LDVRSILCATDLSAAADAALCEGDAIARHHSARLLVLHVRPRPTGRHVRGPDEPSRDDVSALEAVCASVRRVTGRDDTCFRALAARGRAHSEIVRCAEREGVDLVVVGSRGASSSPSVHLGSQATRVVRCACRPVLVVRPSPEDGPVLAATGFFDPSMPEVAAGAAEARRRRCRLSLLHTLTPSTATGLPLDAPLALRLASSEERRRLRREAEEALREAAARYGADGDPLVTEGRPESEIVRVAGERSAALVVVATAGHRGLRRMLLGSVAGVVVRDAPCSVLVVRLAGREATVMTPALAEG